MESNTHNPFIIEEEVNKVFRGCSVRRNEILIQHIKVRGLNISKTAELCGVSRQLLWMIIYGKQKPSMRIVMKLKEVLQVEDSRLIFPDGFVYEDNLENDKRFNVNKKDDGKKNVEQEVDDYFRSIGIKSGGKND
jgi:transcriptional regulator with XRE-family HTH domain